MSRSITTELTRDSRKADPENPPPPPHDPIRSGLWVMFILSLGWWALTFVVGMTRDGYTVVSSGAWIAAVVALAGLARR